MEEHKNNEGSRPQEAPDWAKQTLAPIRPPFAASRKECILAFLLYLLAYVYLGSQWWACRCLPPDSLRRRNTGSGT